MGLWVLVFAVGAVQAAMLALALWRRPANATANRVLATWLALVGLDLGVKAAFLAAPATGLYRALMFVGTFPFLYSVGFHLYVRTLTTGHPLRWPDLRHLAGFAVALSLFLPVLFAPTARLEGLMQAWLGHRLPPPVPWYSLFLYAWSLGYVAAALLRVLRYRREVFARRADADRMSLRWLQVMALGQVAIWATALLHDYTRLPGIGYLTIFAVVAVWACVLGYLALVQGPVSPEGDRAGADMDDVEGQDETVDGAEAGPRAEDDPRLPEVQARLEALMREDALFRAPALTIGQVARRSGYPEYLVSLAINRGHGCTFWEYIGRQRIEAACRHLADPGDRRTILDIAYDCGFTSKSTFNAAFKRVTGQTPSAWRARRAAASPD